jgi:hypothetical protein
MGCKISPRAIGKRGGLQLPFSVSRRCGAALRVEQSEPAGAIPAGFFVCFVRALDPALNWGGDRACDRRSTVETSPDLRTFDAKVLRKKRQTLSPAANAFMAIVQDIERAIPAT